MVTGIIFHYIKDLGYLEDASLWSKSKTIASVLLYISPPANIVHIKSNNTRESDRKLGQNKSHRLLAYARYKN